MDFDLQPILKGRLIDVRPLKPEHYEALFDAASDAADMGAASRTRSLQARSIPEVL